MCYSFLCPPDDLFLSLLFVMTMETDAGLLLQTSEIVQIVLDKEMTRGDQGGRSPLSPLGSGGGFMDEENNLNAAYNNDVGMGMGHVNNGNNNGKNAGPLLLSSGLGLASSASTVELEQNSFLALFCDRYVQWLVAPFQFKVLESRLVYLLLPLNNSYGGSAGAKLPSSNVMGRIRQEFEQRIIAIGGSTTNKDCETFHTLKPVQQSPVRPSFTLEILSFCVRAHVHHMKFFLLRLWLLDTILKVVSQKVEPTRLMPTTNYGDEDVVFCTGF